MKKLFTLICALVGMVSFASASTVDDLLEIKHSMVFVFDDYTVDGTATRYSGTLFGNGYLLDVTGGSVATNKGSVDLSDADTWGEDIATSYGSYGSHMNSLRLKNAQDVIALKVADNTKLIFFGHCNSKTGTSFRCPKIATNAALTEGVLTSDPDATANSEGAQIVKYEYTIANAGTYYIGTYNGDTFFSYLIVEATEIDGTPSVAISTQQYDADAKAYYYEVTCTPDTDVDGLSTVVTYTTDGTAPTASSTLYTEPIKVYGDQMVKFQAFLDAGTGTADDTFLLDGAENEASISFAFNPPTITNDGGNITISSEYDGLVPVTYYYTIDGGSEYEGSTDVIEESSTIVAYMVINNNGNEYTSASTSTDVLLLTPITEEKTITVTSGTAVYNEETLAYDVQDGAISAESAYFFVKDLTFAAVTDEQYQIDGQQVYIKMSDTNITFMLEGSAHVKVITSKNSCKDIEGGTLLNYVNVSGTTYGNDDVTAENGNIIEFDLTEADTYTFQKYSGTGNILISSITITPDATGVASVEAADEAASAAVIKLVKDGQVVIEKGGKQYNVAGAQIK